MRPQTTTHRRRIVVGGLIVLPTLVLVGLGVYAIATGMRVAGWILPFIFAALGAAAELYIYGLARQQGLVGVGQSRPE